MKISRLLPFVATIIALSCNKSSDDTPAETPKTPKLGTTWTYQLDTYLADGTTFGSTTAVLKATSEQTLGGETWLNITDASMNTIYLLNTKSGGLYQYANNASNLLCKDPASVNDTYTAYNNGGDENFTVVGLNVTLGSPNGTSYKATSYEGYKGVELMDRIWYNSEVWFPRRETWTHNTLTGFTAGTSVGYF